MQEFLKWFDESRERFNARKMADSVQFFKLRIWNRSGCFAAELGIVAERFFKVYFIGSLNPVSNWMPPPMILHPQFFGKYYPALPSSFGQLQLAQQKQDQ